MPKELKPHDILAGSSWKDLECATLFRKSGQIGNKPFKNSYLFRKTAKIGNKLMAPAIIYVASSWSNKYQPEVLVLPCGRSAHTEAGWFAGKGLKTIVYMPEKQEPELMYKLFDGVVGSMDELVKAI